MSVGVVSAILCALATAICLRVLRKWSMYDAPSERGSHRTPILRGGGIAPGVVFVAAALLASALSDTPTSGLLAGIAIGAGALCIVGFLDDSRSGISWRTRLVVQVLVGAGFGLALIWMLPTGPRAVAVILCCLAVPVATNSFNFMDGINGITCVTVSIIGATFVVLGASRSSDVLILGGLLAAGVALGFLPFNFPRARVFLGDAGSYFFGGALGLIAVVGFVDGAGFEATAFPFALYLSDTGFTLIRRFRSGASLTTAHRDHVYQRLLDGGISNPIVVLVVAMCTVVLCAAGLATTWTGTMGSSLAYAAATAALLAYHSLPQLRIRIADTRAGGR